MENNDWLILRGVPPAVWSHKITPEKQTIGRLKTCTIHLVHDTVSREHAEVWLVGDKICIRDLGSSNGTFINNERIEEGSFSRGDEVRVGEVFLEATSKQDINASSVYFERKPTKVSTDDDVPDRGEQALEGLSEAQRRVLRSLLTGKSEKVVAEELFISPHTVHSHVKQIYRHFGVSSRAELMASFINRAASSAD